MGELPNLMMVYELKSSMGSEPHNFEYFVGQEVDVEDDDVELVQYKIVRKPERRTSGNQPCIRRE